MGEKKHVEVDLKVLEEVLKERDLVHVPGQLTATVYLVTVKKHQFELQPDYVIDLRKFYEDQGNVKGHELLNGFDYNKTLLPKIRSIQKRSMMKRRRHSSGREGFRD
ncbi:hypothetical protein [Paraflavitalea speifideaquila]|uniref:hypothetical protein n=1 Tax=Paraflavitalea speifideaquila TaxID=3076558 RepID=UPI0028F172B5|nr:hypothetical protein [Paraflavitalea speifideiaquila]